jgi:ABC-2 type transport system permease protein
MSGGVLDLKELLFKKTAYIKEVLLCSFKEWISYRSHMLVSLIVMPLFFLVQYHIWTSVFSSKDTIQSYSLESMLLYFALSTIITGITYDFTSHELSESVQSGELIIFLLRPVSVFYYFFIQKIGHRIIAFFIETVPLILIYIFIFKLKFRIESLLPLILSILLSFILLYLINFIIGLFAFWIIRTDGIRRTVNIFMSFCAGSFIPLVFFPGFIQKILFIMPFQYIIYAPVSIYLGNYSLAGFKISYWFILLMQFIYIIIFYFIALKLLGKAMRKFTGAGV